MMTVDERSRHSLYEQLQQSLGAAAADTLMSYLPPVGWADVVTVQALQRTEDRLDGRIDGVEQRLDAKIDGVEQRLDAKIDGVEQRLDAKIDGFEERLGLRMDSLRDGLTADFRGELVALSRTMLFSAVALAMSFGALVVAATRFG